MNIGTGHHPKSAEHEYLFRFYKSGIAFVVHQFGTKYVLSEWTTGLRVAYIADAEEEPFGLDLIAEVKADEIIAKHGVETVNKFISNSGVINT